LKPPAQANFSACAGVAFTHDGLVIFTFQLSGGSKIPEDTLVFVLAVATLLCQASFQIEE
jgi:hypothetical protein